MILDIGCGKHCLEGAVGIDIKSHAGVKIVHDLLQFPWPIETDSVDSFRCQHVIEHIKELHSFAKEIYRIAKPNSRIRFITPHYSSYASWGDPTHYWHFALGSIPQLFDQSIGEGNFIIIKNEIKFTGSFTELLGWIIYKISPKKYEKHFAWLFPANEIHTELEFLKQSML